VHKFDVGAGILPVLKRKDGLKKNEIYFCQINIQTQIKLSESLGLYAVFRSTSLFPVIIPSAP
jgi:hypothetical protein